MGEGPFINFAAAARGAWGGAVGAAVWNDAWRKWIPWAITPWRSPDWTLGHVRLLGQRNLLGRLDHSRDRCLDHLWQPRPFGCYLRKLRIRLVPLVAWLVETAFISGIAAVTASQGSGFDGASGTAGARVHFTLCFRGFMRLWTPTVICRTETERVGFEPTVP